jgi:hypothetical protein
MIAHRIRRATGGRSRCTDAQASRVDMIAPAALGHHSKEPVPGIGT